MLPHIQKFVEVRPIEFEGKEAKNADFSQKSSIFDVSLHIDNSYNTKNEMLFTLW